MQKVLPERKKQSQNTAGVLYEFIVQSRVQEKLGVQELLFKQHGDRAMEKEYAQIYGIVMNLLDKMVSILGEETVSARRVTVSFLRRVWDRRK